MSIRLPLSAQATADPRLRVHHGIVATPMSVHNLSVLCHRRVCPTNGDSCFFNLHLFSDRAFCSDRSILHMRSGTPLVPYWLLRNLRTLPLGRNGIEKQRQRKLAVDTKAILRNRRALSITRIRNATVNIHALPHAVSKLVSYRTALCDMAFDLVSVFR